MSTLATKYVEFVAKGLDQVADRLDDIKSRFADASAAADKMNKYLAGGTAGLGKLGGAGLEGHRKQVDAVSAAGARLNATLAGARWVQMAAEVKQLTERNKQFEAVLNSGAYAKYARQMAAISAEYRGLQNAARLQDLIAQHGQLGGRVQYLSERYNEATRSAQTAFGVLSAGVLLWVRSGLQGTVEAERLSMAWQMLSREIASVFLPVIREFTSALLAVVDWFRNLDGEGQAVIRTVTLIAVGLLGVAVAGRVILAVLTFLVGGLRAVVTIGSLVVAGVTAIRGAFLALASAVGVLGAVTIALGALVALFGAFSAMSGPKLNSGELSQYLAEADAARLRVVEDQLKLKYGDEKQQNYSALFGGNTLPGDERDEFFRLRAEQQKLLDEGKRELDAQSKGQKPKNRDDVTLAQTGRESFADTYDRLTDALLKVSAVQDSPEAKTAENTESIKGGVDAIYAAIVGWMAAAPDKRS
jgi:hypothetical protein